MQKLPQLTLRDLFWLVALVAMSTLGPVLADEKPIYVADLISEFSKDEQKALRKYGGKEIQVQGTVKSKGVTGTAGEIRLWQKTNIKGGRKWIVCLSKEAGRFDDFREGDSVVLRGKVQKASNYLDGVTTLENCTLVKVVDP